MKRSRRQRRMRAATASVSGGLLLLVVWWAWPSGESRAQAETQPAAPIVTAPQAQPPGPPMAIVSEDPPTRQASDEVLVPRRPAVTEPTISRAPDPEPAPEMPARSQIEAQPGPQEKIASSPAIERALRRYQAGEKVAARSTLNGLLAQSTNPEEQRELRRHLSRIADETVFSRDVAKDDGLFTRHKVASGEYLVHLQQRYDVPYEMIMRINGMRSANSLRAGAILKIPHGPFHAVVDKSEFRLDLYLQNLYVRSFRVGLGAAETGTPEGVWVVKDRLPNPTFFPPASAPDKRIIPGNDPTNPLGEFWIGLRGVEGDAVGQDGFGVHGTIEPDSIGRNASLGCVRMLDDDIRFVYESLLERESKVKTMP